MLRFCALGACFAQSKEQGKKMKLKIDNKIIEINKPNYQQYNRYYWIDRLGKIIDATPACIPHKLVQQLDAAWKSKSLTLIKQIEQKLLLWQHSVLVDKDLNSMPENKHVYYETTP